MIKQKEVEMNAIKEEYKLEIADLKERTVVLENRKDTVMFKCDECDFQGKTKGGTELHKTRKYREPLIISSQESHNKIVETKDTETEVEEMKTSDETEEQHVDKAEFQAVKDKSNKEIAIDKEEQSVTKAYHCTMKNLLKANSVQLLRFLNRKLINVYILPDDFDSIMVKTKTYAKCNVYFCT